MQAIAATVIALALAVASGCASSTRARNVEDTGFLPDYSILKPGDKDQAQRRYVNPNVDWAKYRKVLLDPVTIWRGKTSRNEGISQADAQALADYFHGVLAADLQKEGFILVDHPEPNTLRVQVAITKAAEQDVALDVISTVVPVLRAASGIERLSTGKPSFVGQAQVEVKASDAVSGTLLAAGVDNRVGGKNLNAKEFSSWGDVKSMMDLWAAHGSYELCRLQNRGNCVDPGPGK